MDKGSVVIKKSFPCAGLITLSGAKNASLPIVAASALTGAGTILHNVPVELKDIQVLLAVLREMGIEWHVVEHDLYIDGVGQIHGYASEIAGNIRSGLILLPIFSILCGYSSIPVPGGCKLGDRKYDILLETLAKMGAIVKEEEGRIEINLADKFKGIDTSFHIATTIGSENVILAACLAEGDTVARNANTRPEVIDLENFLNCAGANITHETRKLKIHGVKKLHSCEYKIMTDRHEAVSYMIFAAMHRGEICIKNFDLKYVNEDVELLRRIGVSIYEWGDDVYVSAKGKDLKPFSMVTYPYPGINSDMQPLFAALAATISGESIITDTRFVDRFQYVEEFKKFGIDIVNYENCAIIHGGKELHGAEVTALDLRAGAAVTFLGSVASGRTIVHNFYQVERGYASIIRKMHGLGIIMSEMENDQ